MQPVAHWTGLVAKCARSQLAAMRFTALRMLSADASTSPTKADLAALAISHRDGIPRLRYINPDKASLHCSAARHRAARIDPATHAQCRASHPAQRKYGLTLETSDPLIFFDAMRVKIRDEGLVRNKAVYLALGVQADGTTDILGIWVETTEGAKPFNSRMINERRTAASRRS